MPAPDKVLAVVQEWFDKAENDLVAASHLLKLEDSGPTEVVCFHAQQSVEKYLKSILVWQSIPVPKTHDVEKLIQLIPKKYRIRLSIEEMRILTNYGTEARYPGFGRVPFSEAKEALLMAQRVPIRFVLLSNLL